jgi:hypothetical protein
VSIGAPTAKNGVMALAEQRPGWNNRILARLTGEWYCPADPS